jgi:ribosomal protein S18 acetylase RimI-like enzyme
VTLGNPDRPIGGLAVTPPEGVELRPLGRDDLDALATIGLEPGFDVVEALVNDVDATPFLAVMSGEEPAGLIDFRFRRRLNHATFEGWIGEVAVREAHRGRGIGRALLAAVLAEWRLRGGHQVEIELRREEAAAIGLVEAAGFVNQGLYFELAPVRTREIQPTEGVVIRSIAAADEDFAAVTALLAELGRPAPSDEKLPALQRTYDLHVRRDNTGSMLAELNGTPVGFVSLEFRDRVGAKGPEAWIPDLIVTEAARGRDIGATLLDAAFAEAEARGASAVKLESGSQRLVAHQLYRAAGMVDVGSFLTLSR